MAIEVIQKLVCGEHLTRAEAREALDLLMDGRATAAQIAAILVALRMKGETVEEVTGFAEGMRARAVPVQVGRRPLLDTCGTGGSTFRTFNVSTAAAFVAAAAGIAVAKHGNRAVTGVCGSADVLEALGVRVDLAAEQCAACIETVGIGFLFAQAHHPAMRQVSGPRREIGVRSIFNLLGPLTNPAGATHQVIGVYAAALGPLVAGALRELGSESAMVLHGEAGLDEISTLGPTSVTELRGGEITVYTLTREDLGLTGPLPQRSHLAPAPEAAANADMVREALTGVAQDDGAHARRDLIAVNAAAALRVCDLATTWPDAIRQARLLLASGAALAKLEELISFTHRLTLEETL